MLSLSWPRTVTLASLQRGNDGNWRVAHVVGVRHGGEAEHGGRLAAHAAAQAAMILRRSLALEIDLHDRLDDAQRRFGAWPVLTSASASIGNYKP